MTTPEDILARQAALRLQQNRAKDLDSAIEYVLRDPALPDGPRPGRNRVRKHLHALSLAQLGSDAWKAARSLRLGQIEQMLATLDHFFDPMVVMVAGRAAEGQVDSGDRVHLRVWVPLDLPEILSTLDLLGPLEIGSRRVRPEIASGQSRLTTIALEGDDLDFEITLCPARTVVSDRRNLASGQKVPLSDPESFRRLLRTVDESG